MNQNNIILLSTRIQQLTVSQLDTFHLDSPHSPLQRCETREILDRLSTIKALDRLHRERRTTSQRQRTNNISFTYSYDSHQIDLSQHLYKSHPFNVVSVNEVQYQPQEKLRTGVLKKAKNSVDLSELHKVDQALAYDILHRTCGSSFSQSRQAKRPTDTRVEISKEATQPFLEIKSCGMTRKKRNVPVQMREVPMIVGQSVGVPIRQLGKPFKKWKPRQVICPLPQFKLERITQQNCWVNNL